MFPDFHEGLQIEQFSGVLLGSLDQYDPNQPMRTWQLASGHSSVPVVFASDDRLQDLLSQPLAAYQFRLMDWVGRTANPFKIPAVVVEAEWIRGVSALAYLPMDLCPVGGVLPETMALIDEIQADPLRQFVRRVFEQRDVCAHYWTMPASARHHHAHPGGLAEHSLEVAEDIATQSQLTPIERDLGIAGGLLHDIGKVWACTADMFPNAGGRAMGHELIGLSRMERHLQTLESHWPDGAYAMRVLLSGCSRPRPDGSMPSALVTRIRACDQRSCERDQGQAGRKNRSWTPEPWLPPAEQTPPD